MQIHANSRAVISVVDNLVSCLLNCAVCWNCFEQNKFLIMMMTMMKLSDGHAKCLVKITTIIFQRKIRLYMTNLKNWTKRRTDLTAQLDSVDNTLVCVILQALQWSANATELRHWSNQANWSLYLANDTRYRHGCENVTQQATRRFKAGLQ